jgi:hypothetical protein
MGEQAVRTAQEARRFRMADAAADLDGAGDLEIEGGAVVAGRVFVEKGGVWTEAGVDESLPEVRVRRFSPAWFRLIEALPEIAAAARRFETLTLAGRTVRLRLDDGGVERWPTGELERVVADFRAAR